MLNPHALASLGFRFSPIFRALLGVFGYDEEPPAADAPAAGGVSAPMRIRRKKSLFKPVKPIPLPMYPHVANRKEEEFFLLAL